MKLHLIGTLAFALTACAIGVPVPMPGGPLPPPNASSVAEEAIKPREGAGAITVLRDKQLFRRKCSYDLAIDGEPVAALRAGEKVVLYADPGDRRLSVTVGRDGGCDPAVAEVPLKVVANAMTKIRVRHDYQYDLKVEATTF